MDIIVITIKKPRSSKERITMKTILLMKVLFEYIDFSKAKKKKKTLKYQCVDMSLAKNPKYQTL